MQLDDFRRHSFLLEMQGRRQYAGDCPSTTELPLDACLDSSG